MYATTLFTLALAGGAFAHGLISSPAPRGAGSAYKAACGSTIFNTMSSDPAGNVQDLLNKRDAGFDPTKCNLWLCKGFQLDDNRDKIQKYSPGQVVPIAFDIRAPHTGTANASIVDLKTNTLLGKELIYFADFASTHHVIPDSNRNFEVTIPDLGNMCATAGDCAIQFFWDSREANQSYESCIDFTQSTGAAPAPAPAPAPEPATTTKEAPAVTTPAKPPTVPTQPPVVTEAPPVPSPTSIDCEPDETTTPAAPVATPTTVPSTAGRDCNVLVPKCWAEQKQCWDDAQKMIQEKGWNAASQAAQAACGKKGEECNQLNCSWTLTGRKLRA